ncbi:MAG: 23S rRNA (guanosine(2251)-2'-O)-methyltransferase RlmB [Candidatus Aminicenantes bacterium]|nr:23S rRNA (guanosine(2251)-2'-O)-methyltransferase RlmB [Candidatus Aminicenantes bacterium]NIM78406.1 23S rRNA (guanosine(2251)-2'-O)-methyltransferase RlmB [Candidatus Aminicenantes bacterium]NIN17668.1 23S rRNA (guanosine(2251)-2'-O)-methyltransferase RlmB [Candidatus Aminicenantes bacterium]NIN41544.1 23S rRNA (guanosine(2251)-2'-O)-methyltransferase RlmB [Candidatus Aminicenantes bacterium]NIN84318.1 23S rRNA (guanosine(2251)-2'-O)-methyltransferase RlmB [Candidatus Aminicenantes bacteri
MNINSLHALIEALRERIPINKVFISTDKKGKRIDQVIKLCRQNSIVFQMVPPQTINRKAGPNNQGVFAEVSPIRFYTLEDILQNIKTGLILVLDGINDTGNMGAIIRSAVAAEVDGIIIPQRNSAPINETVLKTSAGSLVKAKIVQSKNLVSDIKKLKKNEFWVVGTVKEREKRVAYYDYDFTVNTAVIMGSEHKGMSPLLRKNADLLIYIPHSEDIDSLNVSAAAAVILFEALRQKEK